MFKRKKNSHVSISLNDYVLRALVSRGQGLEQLTVYEIPLPRNVVQDGTIVDEAALFELVKANVSKWGGRHKHDARFFVPDSSVLLKTFEHPANLTSREINEYVQMELGQSIHLPFHDPLIDIYDHIEGDGKAVLFAAPPEEVMKYVGMLLDLQLQPQAADIRALCNVRLLDHLQLLDQEKTYLFADCSINELSICIYSAGDVEFLRFQAVETDLDLWQPKQESEHSVDFEYVGDYDTFRSLVLDQLLEIDRMMNFFKFSLHKGEKNVDEIIFLGDQPLLNDIETIFRENFVTPIMTVTDEVIEEHFPGFKAKHASLLGLALKEVQQ